jgi:energy-coupling factor transport system permease protein
MESGLYLPGEGVIHRWHPRTKLALALASFPVAFADVWLWHGVPLGPWVGVAFLLVLALMNGPATFRTLLRRAALLLGPILISIVLINGFFFPGAENVLLQIGPFDLRSEGLLFGAIVFSRLSLIAFATLLLVIATHPADLTQGLTQVGIPREVAYIILTALQLIPRMQARAESISSAQRARGLRTEGGLSVRARALLPLVGPLITSALQDTEERALALEARAFRAPGPKSFWRQLFDTPAQRVARWLLLLGSLALFIWARFL